jgi:hypothetical protein
MEKKIYELQLRKVALSKRIIDRKATERHFRRDQLNEFFDVDGFKSVSHRALSPPPLSLSLFLSLLSLSLSPVSFKFSCSYTIIIISHHHSSFLLT